MLKINGGHPYENHSAWNTTIKREIRKPIKQNETQRLSQGALPGFFVCTVPYRESKLQNQHKEPAADRGKGGNNQNDGLRNFQRSGKGAASKLHAKRI